MCKSIGYIQKPSHILASMKISCKCARYAQLEDGCSKAMNTLRCKMARRNSTSSKGHNDKK